MASESIKFSNSDPRLLGVFCRWLRCFFDVEEQRLRVHLSLHEGLDLAAAVAFWSHTTGVPPEQFSKPCRAAARPNDTHHQA